MLQLLRAGAGGRPASGQTPPGCERESKHVRRRAGRQQARGLLRGAAAAGRSRRADRLGKLGLCQLGDHSVQLGLGIGQGGGGLVLRRAGWGWGWGGRTGGLGDAARECGAGEAKPAGPCPPEAIDHDQHPPAGYFNPQRRSLSPPL